MKFVLANLVETVKDVVFDVMLFIELDFDINTPKYAVSWGLVLRIRYFLTKHSLYVMLCL